MSIPNPLKCLELGNEYCLFDACQIDDFSPKMLSALYWQKHKAVTGSAQGRGTTWFVKYISKNHDQAQHWVLRHYYRGGLVGKLIKDSYIFTGQKRTRAAKEFSLLSHMQALTLPAPKPIAYRVIRNGLIYQADLLSTRIENAQDLVAILSESNISADVWKKIGATIKRFHHHNIYHHDLNAHNILIDKADNVFLIDFDRGEIRDHNQSGWQKDNLDRLQRSLLKEQKQLPNFHWTHENWQLLLKAYLSHEP